MLRGLRGRLALAFAGAVAAAMLLFGGVLLGVVAYNEGHGRVVWPSDDNDVSSVEHVIYALVAAIPLVIAAAAGLGLVFARTALRPMREASARARAARASELDLSLPVTGNGDEWDELAQTLNTLLADARAGLARVRGFTADAAHELKTPLTAMMGTAEVALRRERPASEYRASLEEMRSDAERLSKLVEALLTLARADAGVLVPKPQPVDVVQLVKDAAQRAKSVRPDAAVDIEVPVDGVRTSGDPVLLGRVLDNLLENAARYGAAPYAVRLQVDGGTAFVEVQDQGPGIKADFVPRLFLRFAHGEARAGQGQGLGLAISRAIAGAHKGSLELLPSEKGARFRLGLPL
jgi:signal transduction histidine kinase